MRGTDYIKSDYENEYLLERENLSDRIIEAQYNMLFLEAVCNKRDNYKEEDLTNKFEILIVLKRIYAFICITNSHTTEAFASSFYGYSLDENSY